MEAQWECLNTNKSLIWKEKSPISNYFQCSKAHCTSNNWPISTQNCKLLCDCLRYFVVHKLYAVKNSFSTYVCYAPDGLFWLNLYSFQSLLKFFMYDWPQRRFERRKINLSFSHIIVRLEQSSILLRLQGKTWMCTIFTEFWNFPRFSPCKKLGKFRTLQNSCISKSF